MMICHCMSITDKDSRRAMDWMRASDPDTIITPGKVYRALGKKADCGGCLPHFVDTMQKTDSLAVPKELRGLRRAQMHGDNDEGRREGHRVPEQSATE
jgi:bacterioferritin-associated ferredoxin